MLGALAACGRIGFDARPDDPAIEVDEFSTSSPAFEPVPDATLTIPPSASRWLLMTTATLQSDSLDLDAGAELRYLLDGVELGLGATQNSELDRPGPFQHFAAIEGAAVAQTVSFELHDLGGGTATVRHLRAYAIPTQPAIYETADAMASVTAQVATPVATFAVEPGDYLFFGLVNASEDPGNSDCHTQWRAASGALAGKSMQNPRGARQPRISIWRESIAIPSTIALEARVGNNIGTVEYIRLLGYRVADLVLDLVAMPAEVTTTTEAKVLELVPTITAGRYLFIASSRLEEQCDGNGVSAGREITFAGPTTSSISHAQDNCAYENSYGVVELFEQRPGKLSTTIRSTNGEEVVATDSTLLLLGL